MSHSFWKMKMCVACFEGRDRPEFSAYLHTLPGTVFPVYDLDFNLVQ